MKRCWIILIPLALLSFAFAQGNPDSKAMIELDKEPVPQNMEEVQKLIGYPEQARQEKTQGMVVLRILVDEQGAYLDHEVVVNPGDVLTQAVEAHVSKLRFSPAIKDEEAVKAWINLPFNFKLIE